jgi:colicin import membrane protein
MQPTKAGRQCLRALEVFNGSENGQATTICAHKPEAEAEAEEDEEDGRVTTKHVAA